MDFHLIYSKEAISDLEAILDEISVDDPGAAMAGLPHRCLLYLYT